MSDDNIYPPVKRRIGYRMVYPNTACVKFKSIGCFLCVSFCLLLVVISCCDRSEANKTCSSEEFFTEFTYSTAKGLGSQKGVTRRDPSDIIKVGSTYYLWYTRTLLNSSGYNATIWYATSSDGITWSERGEAIGRGVKRSWDEHSVFTPNILVAEGRYYLFYTAVPEPFTNDNGGQGGTKTAIGVAVCDSPDGPWRKKADNPILRPGGDNSFDSHRVDDACLIVRNGEYWLYYKGRQLGLSSKETKVGVAIAKKPEGPYVKSKLNPLIKSGHEVLVWPYREGVAALIGPTGPEKNTIQYAPDGLNFCVKAHIKNAPKAPGGYRPDAFSDTHYGGGMSWGVSMKGWKEWPYLVRFDCNLAVQETKSTATLGEK